MSYYPLLIVWLTGIGLFMPSPDTDFNTTLTNTCTNNSCCALHAASEKAENTLAFGQSMGKYIKQSRINEDNYELKTVVIDAGHGGGDSGARGRYTYEKHITLSMAKQLGSVLKSVYPNLNIIYTRTDDVAVPLYRRAFMANENKADLFLSIHCNFFQASSASGTETYVMGLHTANYNLQVAKRENSAILMEENYKKNYGGYDPNSPEGHIILSMYQNTFLEQSIAFADKIEQQFSNKADRKSRGVKQAGFVVLKGTTMPSVLIELGFLSNRHEERYLASQIGQQQLSASIAQAFVEYKNEVEGNKSSAKIDIPMPEAVVIPESKTTDVSPVEPKPKPVSTLQKTEPVQKEKPAVVKSQAQSKLSNSPNSQTAPTPQSKPIYADQLNASDIHFKVLLLRSPRLLPNDSYNWDEMPYLIEVKEHQGSYHYMAAGFESYEQATIAKTVLRNRYFPQAFVIATARGKRLSMQEALKIVKP